MNVQPLGYLLRISPPLRPHWIPPVILSVFPVHIIYFIATPITMEIATTRIRIPSLMSKPLHVQILDLVGMSRGGWHGKDPAGHVTHKNQRPFGLAGGNKNGWPTRHHGSHLVLVYLCQIVSILLSLLFVWVCLPVPFGCPSAPRLFQDFI